MMRTGLVLAAAALVSSPLPAQTRAELEAKEEFAFKQAAALVSPSVVRIETVGGLDRVGQVLTGTGPTTGVIISSDGYILSSAFNFAAKPTTILVTLPLGQRVPAEMVATDKVHMLTLLRVEARDLPVSPHVGLESVRVGQWSIAVGRALGDDEPNVSVGIVSAVKRIWGKAIQTDAKISPSNYGGPLVDVEGRILGILVPLSPSENSEVAGVGWYDSGIGFAIPMPAALESAGRLKAGKDLLPGLIGISFKGRNIYDGEPVIDRVRYGSPAAKAGIKPGDVIVEADGLPTPRQAALRQVLGNKFADDLLTLTVRRGAERIRVEVTLVAELLPYESPFLGVLPARAAAAAGGEAPAGVGIRYVYPDSPASQAGLQEGDRITSADGQPVADAAALYDVVSRRRVGDRIPLQYQRDGESRTAEAALSSIPAVTPPELQRVFIEAPANPPAADGPKLGRYTDRLPGHEQDYWAYVPEGYNAAAAYGLVVFLHPGGDTMEAAMIKEWKSLCDERGLILAGPKAKQIAGWQPNEADFVVEVLDHFVKTYHIDPERVVVHSHGNAGVMAWHTAFEHRDKVRGAIVSGMPLTRPLPDNEPDLRFQAYLYAGMRDPLARGVQQAAELLRAAKFPVQSTIFPELDASYPPTVVIEEMARWIDALDRI